MADTPRRPRFSVVTPSLNQAAYLEEAIRSVAEQGGAEVEHWVIDGGSTDGTLEILRRHPAVRWLSEPDRGQSEALNKGFRRASGAIVGWLNADDRYLPGAFDAVAAAFDADPRADVVYGDCRWVDEAGRPIEYRKGLPFDRFLLRYMHFLWIPSTATFFRRSVFDGGAAVDPAYHQAMDYELFLRLANDGRRFRHIEAFLADFRLQADSKTARSAARQLEEHRRASILHSPLLQRMPAPAREPLWRALNVVARGKRAALRLVRGHYARRYRPGVRPGYLR